MFQSIAKKIQNPEREAWELFEVGSYEEVLQLAKKYPESRFTSHLGFLASQELGLPPMDSFCKGVSILSPLLEAYQSSKRNQIQESSNHIEVYLKNKNIPMCYPIAKFCYTILHQVGKNELALYALKVYRNEYKNPAFVKEEAILCYKLERYNEVEQLWMTYPNELNDPEIFRIVGMALLFLGKNSEAETILRKIQGKLKLPSFEDKKKEYSEVYKNIHQLEKSRSKLSPRQMEDLGFAYLFHSEFEKAESVFRELVARLKQQSYTVSSFAG